MIEKKLLIKAIFIKIFVGQGRGSYHALSINHDHSSHIGEIVVEAHSLHETLYLVDIARLSSGCVTILDA